MAVLCLITVILQAAGCDSSSDKQGKTSAQITEDLANLMVTGIDYRDRHIQAERFDPISRELLGVRVSNKEGMLYAGKGGIHIDPITRTMWLELEDIVLARPETDGEEGELWWTFASITLDPVSIDDYLVDGN